MYNCVSVLVLHLHLHNFTKHKNDLLGLTIMLTCLSLHVYTYVSGWPYTLTQSI